MSGLGWGRILASSYIKQDDKIGWLRKSEAGMFWEAMSPFSHLCSAQDCRGKAAAPGQLGLQVDF